MAPTPTPVVAAAADTVPPLSAEMLAEIAADHGSVMSAFRWARPGVAHIRLADHRVLVVETHPTTGQVSRVLTPDDYARVNLAEVRHPSVAAIWDVHTGWDDTGSAAVGAR